MTDSGDSRGSVYFVAHQSGRVLRRFTRVDSHANTQDLTIGPVLDKQSSLNTERRGDARARRRKDGEERVALCALLPSAVF